ncbi:GNAT family N-acetyltransferase [Sulfitobacter aestuarii]|uniref:GNAT family N-acetyltransferase n=1 Tax=Sulfitobacter aestuarii TaxID=2161676 RepID=A0ABW5U6E5_9RHOB
MSRALDGLYTAIDGTWPAARSWVQGPWRLREGHGGGQRVCAATAEGDVSEADIADAEAGMRDLNQQPLFMIRQGEDVLDALLAARGYEIVDPTHIYEAPIENLTDVPIPRVTAFSIWEPLAIMKEIWAKGGIGVERLAVMARAEVKTGILARWNEQPAGVAFAAVQGDICMVHAVEVLPHQRQQGVARWIMRRAAFWGQAQGATRLAALCVAENRAANGLYRALGFELAGGYHYRRIPE